MTLIIRKLAWLSIHKESHCWREFWWCRIFAAKVCLRSFIISFGVKKFVLNKAALDSACFGSNHHYFRYCTKCGTRHKLRILCNLKKNLIRDR